MQRNMHNTGQIYILTKQDTISKTLTVTQYNPYTQIKIHINSIQFNLFVQFHQNTCKQVTEV